MIRVFLKYSLLDTAHAILDELTTGAPEAVLDWGGGGGKDLRGLTIFFFLLGAHQWRRQLFGMEGGGKGTIFIDKKLPIGRAEVFVIIIFLAYC